MFADVKYVELATGVRVQYAEQGSYSGVPVVMLHGYSDSWHSFEPILPFLPSSIHSYAISQRGHGNTGRPTAGYGPSDFAEDLAEFMDALEIDSAVVVGHSLGSLIAQRFALDYPERTQGLVLAGTFPTMRGNRDVQELWNSYVSTMTDPVDRRFVVRFQESTLAQSVPERFFETVIHESLKVPARVWRAVFAGLLQEDFSSELMKLKLPTLIVWGDRDAICLRRDQAVLARNIPTSRLVVYSETGHALHWEEPEHFADDLVEFTIGLNRRAKSID